MILLGSTILRAGEKIRIDFLNFDYSKKRAFSGTSSIGHAAVTLRMPFVLAQLAEEDFFVFFGIFSCLFHFRCFSKNKYDFFVYSFVLRFRTILAAI